MCGEVHRALLRERSTGMLRVLETARSLGVELESEASERLREEACRGALLEALAYAHRRGVIHLDVKPENILLFKDGPARLADFGLSKIAAKATCSASGLGTVGYYAPEQAFGRPSRRSDVFSAGLVIWRLLAGALPSWPFAWPPPGLKRVEAKAGLGATRVLRRAMQLDASKRFDDAGEMLSSFCNSLSPAPSKRRSRA